YAELCGRAVPFPENGYQGDYVRDVAATLREREGDRLMQEDPAAAAAELGDAAGAILLEAIRDDTAALAIHFDHYVSERRLRAEGAVDATLTALEKAGYVYEA